MASKKCLKCNNNITKRSPGLECSRCEKVVHATSECAKITTKQLAALRASDGLEWSCNDCLQSSSRRTSFFIPEDDSEDGTQTGTADINKLMRSFTTEIKKTIKEELEGFQQSLEFIGDQVTNIEEILKNQNSKIKQLENKNMELVNVNKNLELRLSAMEQRLDETEQKSLCTLIEIAGIPSIESSEIKEVTETIAAKLKVGGDTIQNVRQVTGRSENSGYLLVELNTKASRDTWLSAAKSKGLTLGDISLPISKGKEKNRIFVREALTRNLKSLLYQAKQRLKTPNGQFKYVWCKTGKIYVKKNDDSKKVDIIRSTQDIDNLLNVYHKK